MLRWLVDPIKLGETMQGRKSSHRLELTESHTVLSDPFGRCISCRVLILHRFRQHAGPVGNVSASAGSQGLTILHTTSPPNIPKFIMCYLLYCICIRHARNDSPCSQLLVRQLLDIEYHISPTLNYRYTPHRLINAT